MTSASENIARAGLPKSLTELANLHGTDKGTVGPSQSWGANNYTDVYEGYMEPYRWFSISILEIGLGVPGSNWDARIAHGRNAGGGGSLKLWYDYFPHAKIYGIDVNSGKHLDNDRIRTWVVDQGDPAQLQKFVSLCGETQFDIIIDDGSHRPDHQQISFAFFFPRLKPKGLYVIEDLMSNGLGDGAEGRHSNDTVLNTRRVLRSFKESGRFAKPHALGSTDELEIQIASIGFHSPTTSCRRIVLGRLTRLLNLPLDVPQYQDERLCVIRKK